MIEPRDGNEDETGLLAEADAIRYGDPNYIPEAWRGRNAFIDDDDNGSRNTGHRSNGGGYDEVDVRPGSEPRASRTRPGRGRRPP